MNKKQRDNIYYTAMKKIMLDEKSIIDFDNGDILAIQLQTIKHSNKEETNFPMLVMQTIITNIDGDIEYEGKFYKSMDRNQTLKDILNASDVEKISFILDKEKGVVHDIPYNVVESNKGKISRFTSRVLREYAKESLLSMKQEIEEYDKKQKKSV